MMTMRPWIATEDKNLSTRFYEPRSRVLYNQDLFISIGLSQFSISKYLLFIKKDAVYTLATFRGYSSSQVERLVFNEDSIVVQSLIQHHRNCSRSDMHNYFRETVFYMPKEANPKIEQEQRCWDELGPTDYFPFFEEDGQLIGFCACSGKLDQRREKDYVEFLQAMQVWAGSYYDLHIDYINTKKMDRYIAVNNFINTILESKDIHQSAKIILESFLDILKAKQGILFERQKNYFVPLAYSNLAVVKIGVKESFDACLSKATRQQIPIPAFLKGIFESEVVEMIRISPKHTLFIRPIFQAQLEEELLATIVKVSSRVLSCK